jgi:hypothetical protein
MLVLFVDEYERVFEEGGAGARWRDNPFDSHMRTLIQNTNGLLAVFFSRERLPWEADPDWRGDLNGAQHLLGGLVDRDADEFLRAIPIDSVAFAPCMARLENRSEARSLSLTLFNYLVLLATLGKLGRTENEVATHILEREAYAMLERGFHEEKIPSTERRPHPQRCPNGRARLDH